MNKAKIEELANKAGITFKQMVIEGDEYDYYHVECNDNMAEDEAGCIRNFAELIVRECADVIQKEVSTKYKDGGDTEDFMAGHYAASLMARVVIRNHFGVEE
jgi:hypothetical protein